MIIRDASMHDADAVAAIYNHYIEHSTATFETAPLTPEHMADRIRKTQSAGYDWLVAEEAEQIMGYAYSGRWMAREAYRFTVEVSVYVAAKAQGRGAGRKLYDDLFARLRAADFHTVIGIITLPNAASIALHESYGMKQVAHYEEVGRKFEQWINVGQWQGRLS